MELAPALFLFWNSDAGRILDQSFLASMHGDRGIANEASQGVYGVELESDARECENT